jgi:hypothetical protein
MPVELSQLMNLALGRIPSLFVGELPRPVAAYLGANPGCAYLGRDELAKIVGKHPDVVYEDVQHVPYAIRRGYFFRHPKKPNCVTLIWKREDNGKHYLLGLKAANSGEVWVQTMHRLSPRKAKNRENTLVRITGF